MTSEQLRTYARHLGLFLLTLIATTLVGAEHVTGRIWFGWGMVDAAALLSAHEIWLGLPYSISFLTFLTFHEFGHYLTAVYHRIRVSLPYYIPFYIPLSGLVFNIGSFGAVIRLKEIPDSTRKFFDVGIAGPLAGFVVSVLLLVYGFSHLPPVEDYVLNIHPDYLEQYGGVPTENQQEQFILESGGQTFRIGTSLLFSWLRSVVPDDPSQVPTQFELIHYPFLFVGYLTLFFTALNLLPIGQLDGGHIVYGMFGRKIASLIARIAVIALLFIGGAGLLNPVRMEAIFVSFGGHVQEMFAGYNPETATNLFYDLLVFGGLFLYARFIRFVYDRIFPVLRTRQTWMLSLITLLAQALVASFWQGLEMNFIWLLYAFLVVRFLGVDHPEAYHEHKVNLPRQVLGWVAIVIFILCFSPSPIEVIGG